jgi:hypothetical protein
MDISILIQHYGLKNLCMISIIPIGKIKMHGNMLLVQRTIDNESFTIEISIAPPL